MHLLARRICFPITTHWVVPVRRTTLHRTGSLSNRSDLRHMLACAFQIDDFHALTMISDDEMFELPLLQWHLVSGFFSCWSKSDAAREDLEWIAMCSSYGLLLALIDSHPFRNWYSWNFFSRRDLSRTIPFNFLLQRLVIIAIWPHQSIWHPTEWYTYTCSHVLQFVQEISGFWFQSF